MKLLSQSLPFWQRCQLRVINFWFALSQPEKLYFAALVSWAVFVGDLVVTSILTFLAITLEFWPRFAKWWDSLAGKAVILLFYGTLTNFALVSASSLVNQVTLVPASHFNYTHNFALLLMLPSWFIVTSFIALLLFQLIAPFYLLLLLILKPFGISKVRLLSKSEYPLFTNLLRFSLSMLLLVQLVTVLDDNASQVNEFIHGVEEEFEQTNSTESDLSVALDESKDKVPALIPGSQDKQVKNEAAKKEPDLPPILTLGEYNKDDATKSINIQLSDGYEGLIRSAIAHFAFHLEADQYSRCQKMDNSRIIELNDYEILEITQNIEAKNGFDFIVKKCISPAFPEN